MSKGMIRPLFWGAVLLFSYSCFPAYGADKPSAIVHKLENKVETLKWDSRAWESSYVDELLISGDTMRTGKDSRSELKFNDGSVVRLSSLSVLKMEKPQELKLSFGKILLSVIKGKGGIRVVTPSAVAGSLGTTWMTEVGEDHSTKVTVLEGTVELTSGGKTVELLKGMASSVLEGKPPSLPEKVDLEYILNNEELITRFEPLEKLKELRDELEQKKNQVEALRDKVKTPDPKALLNLPF